MKKSICGDDVDKNEIHPLITKDRHKTDRYYVIARQFSGKDMELVAMKMGPDDSLKRGGGARRKVSEKSQMDDTTLAKSQQRAKRNARIKCRVAQVDHLLTLTFRENITDYDLALKIFKKFIRVMRKKYRERFIYVAVPEEQKRGAYHFHLAIKGSYPYNIVRKIWRNAIESELGSSEKSAGNIDIASPKGIGKSSWNPVRIAQYLAKYITKNDTVGFNRKRFYAGGSIVEPLVKRGWMGTSLNSATFHLQIFGEVFRIHVRQDPQVTTEFEGYYQVVYQST